MLRGGGVAAGFLDIIIYRIYCIINKKVGSMIHTRDYVYTQYDILLYEFSRQLKIITSYSGQVSSQTE